MERMKPYSSKNLSNLLQQRIFRMLALVLFVMPIANQLQAQLCPGVAIKTSVDICEGDEVTLLAVFDQLNIPLDNYHFTWTDVSDIGSPQLIIDGSGRTMFEIPGGFCASEPFPPAGIFPCVGANLVYTPVCPPGFTGDVYPLKIKVTVTDIRSTGGVGGSPCGGVVKEDIATVRIRKGAIFTKCIEIDSFLCNTPPLNIVWSQEAPIEPNVQTFNQPGCGIGGNRMTTLTYRVGTTSSSALIAMGEPDDNVEDIDGNFPFRGAPFYAAGNDPSNRSDSQLKYGPGLGLDWQECVDNENGYFSLVDYYIETKGTLLTITLTDINGLEIKCEREMNAMGIAYDEHFDLTDFEEDPNYAFFDWTNVDMMSFDFEPVDADTDLRLRLIEFCKQIPAEIDPDLKICLGDAVCLDTLFVCHLGLTNFEDPPVFPDEWNIEWDLSETGNTWTGDSYECLIPLNAGMATWRVTITDDIGCETIDEIVLKVCAPPGIGGGGDLGAICFDDIYTITQGVDYTFTPGTTPETIYTWTSPTGNLDQLDLTDPANPVVTPLAPGAPGDFVFCLDVASDETGGTGIINNNNGISECPGGGPGGGPICFTITVDSLPVAVITGVFAICMGEVPEWTAGPDGADLYEWTFPGGARVDGQTILAVALGVYTVTVTDSNGCTGESSQELLLTPFNPTVSAFATPSGPVCAGTEITLTAIGAGGDAPYTYEWEEYRAPPAINIPIGSTDVVTNVVTSTFSSSPPNPYSYSVTVTDVNGCTGETTVAIEVTPNDIFLTTSTTPDRCDMGTTGSATVDVLPAPGPPPAGPVYTYLWDANAGGQTNPTAINLTPGSYTVTVSDASGCSATTTAVVENIPPPTVTIGGAPANVCPNTELTLTANPLPVDRIYTYTWGVDGGDVSSIMVTPTAPSSTYNVTVTDELGCTGTAAVTVGVHIPPSVTITPASTTLCAGQSVGLVAEVQVGTGTGPFSYDWTPIDAGLSATNIFNPTATPTSSESYTVLVTDANGCTGEATTVITVNANPTVDIVVDQDEQCNKANGIATATGAGTGPLTYLWSNGDNTATATGLSAAGSPYTVTVTDGNNPACTATAQVSVLNLDAPTVTIDPIAPYCAGTQSTLSLNANPSGGTPFDPDAPPYTYLWSYNGLTTEDIVVDPAPLVDASYTITVTDSEGCTAEATVDVTVWQNPTVSIDAPITEVCDGTSVTLTAIGVEGSGGSLQYLWSPTNETTPTITPTPGVGMTTYSVVVMDDNNCVGTDEVEITVNPNPTVDIVIDAEANCGQSDGQATANPVPSPDFPTPTYTYLWSNGQTTRTAVNLAAGEYTVTVTDQNDCTAENIVTIDDLDPPTVFIEVPPVICIGDDLIITARPNPAPGDLSGFPPTPATYSYNWIPGTIGDVQSFMIEDVNNNPMQYFVTVTDQNNCTATATLIPEVLGCGEIVMTKSDPVITQVSAYVYDAVYTITVENPGTGDAEYDLTDTPLFEGDVEILAASFTTNFGPSNPDLLISQGPGPWTLATAETVPGPGFHVYYLTVQVRLDLNNPPPITGDGTYVPCGGTPGGPGFPMVGEGLYNQATITSEVLDEPFTDDGCGDLPFVTHDKYNVVANDLGGGNFEVIYDISVSNEGGAVGNYDLTDTPGFDDDFVITSASYVSDAPDNPGGGLAGSGPWPLATDQDIDPAPGQNVHNYTVTVYVSINLSDPDTPGDGEYTACGTTPGAGGNPTSGEGLYNSTSLNLDDDPDPEEEDEICTDIEIFDLALIKVLDNEPTQYNEWLTFTITVTNQGNRIAENIELVDYIPAGYTFDETYGNNNGVWSAGPMPTAILPGGPLLPGESRDIKIDLFFTMAASASDWINYAEISGADDQGTGIAGVDVDSTPNMIDNDDGGGVLDGTTDNYINGDGTGVPGVDLPTEGDEDDHDPASPNLFDLALIKVIDEITTPAPYQYGDFIKFDIQVINQGTEDAYDVEITDYVPCGFDFAAGGNVGWTFNVIAGTWSKTIDGPIVPGQIFTESVTMQVVQCDTPTESAWTNYAEISSADNNENPNDTPPTDIDSTPDDTNSDPGGEPNGPSDDSTIGDGTGPVGGGPADQDEDDHDPAYVEVFDLALIKVLTNSPTMYGEFANFNIEIHNQGNVPAWNIKITDHLPVGLAPNFLQTGFIQGWDLTDMSNPMITVAEPVPAPLSPYPPGPLLPGESITIPISVSIVQTGGGLEDWVNYAEISDADDDTDPNNPDPLDIDSTPGSNSAAELLVMPGDADDNNLNGGGPAVGEDEDDHDPAGLFVGGGNPIVDLALTKVIDTPLPVGYGDPITFSIEVCNQGGTAVQNIDIVDYIPVGYDWDPGSNPGWTFNPFTRIARKQIQTIAPLEPGSCVTEMTTLVLAKITDPLDYADGWTNYAEIEDFTGAGGAPIGPDWDSTPDADNTNDAGGIPNGVTDNETGGTNLPMNPTGIDDPLTDEDDHDPAYVEVFDLALTKVLDFEPTTYNQLLTFTITVVNQGNTIAENIELVDYIPAGYTFSATDPNNLGVWSAAPMSAIATLPGGPLLPGESRDIKIDLFFIMAASASDWTNYAEISYTDKTGYVLNPTTGLFELVTQDATGDDVDSTPDTNDTNDDGGVLEGTTDNYIDGDGKSGLSAPGQDLPTGGDEDDHDPAAPNVFDLALIKVITSGVSYNYGDPIGYEIQVTNQGTEDAYDVEVTDYVPCGLDFDAGGNIGWSYDPFDETYSMIIDGPIVPGQTVTLVVNMVVVPCDTPTDFAWTNFAEISSADNNEDPDDTPPTDIDSFPNDDPTDDSGGIPDGATDDETDGDNSAMNPPGSDDPALDEDDHDPAYIEVFDLALAKYFEGTPEFIYGTDVTFNIEVTNQGNITATNITVRDHLPPGYILSGDPINGIWTADGTSNVSGITYNDYTALIAGPLAPGASETIQLVATIIMSDGDSKDWINYSEIQNAQDDTPIDRFDDIDSEVNSNNPAENSVLPGSPDDNNILGGGPSVGEDEDDHDPEGFAPFDLALRKRLVDSSPYLIGNTVTFQIDVINQGGVTATDVEIIDYLADGLGYLPSNFFLGWDLNVPENAALQTIASIDPGQTITLTIQYELLEADVYSTDWDNYAEISAATDATTGLPGVDVDSDPDTDVNDDDGGVPEGATDDVVTGNGTGGMDVDNPAGDEDDHDPERVPIYDLALIKEIDETETPGPYVYGDEIRFEITVCNQGNQETFGIEVSDYMPEGYSYGPSNTEAWAGPFAGPNPGENTWTLGVGSLLPEQCVTVPIYMVIEQTDGGDKDWINYGSITDMRDAAGAPVDDYDSIWGSDNPDERGVEPGDPRDDDMDSHDRGFEEDDHDPAGIEIFDLAQRKVILDNGPYDYGQPVTFTLEIFNQGSQTASDIEITDFIPCGLTLDDGSWTDNGDTASKILLGVTLAPGEMTTTTITFIVGPCPDMPDDAWTNYTEITDSFNDDEGAPGDDFDSTTDVVPDPDNDSGGVPDSSDDDNVDGDSNDGEDEDDHDPERLLVFDLALKKTMDDVGPFVYGQPITFTIEVTNQGNITATSITIQDIIPTGFSLSVNPLNAIWVPGLAPNEVQTTIDGPLLPGFSMTRKIVFDLEMTDGGEEHWVNFAQIQSAFDDSPTPVDMTGEDADSNPDSENPEELAVRPGVDPDDDITSIDKGKEEDDHDPAGPEIFDLAVFMLDDTDILANYGDDVTFPIMVFNQGNTSSDGFTLTDYVPSGYVFNIGDNPGWVDNNDGTVSYTHDPVFVPGEQVDLVLVLETQPSNGNNNWTNVIEISDDNPISPSGQNLIDIDSTPNAIQGDDAGGAAETDSDDTVIGNGTGVPLDTNEPTDEDDQDPEFIRVFDLALKKELLTNEPYMYGQTHEFEVCVTNQGNEPMINVLVYDNLPDGYTYNDGLSTDWNPVDANTASLAIDRINVGETLCYSLFATLIMTEGGSDAWVNYARVESMQDTMTVVQDDVDSDPGSDYPGELGVQPGGPGDDDIDSLDEGGEEDDHDPAGPDIYDLALRKTQFTQGESFTYGSVILYEIELFNQGNIDVTNVNVVDILPCGLDFNGGNNPGWSYDSNTGEARFAWSGNLVAGTSTSVFLEVQVVPCFEDNDGELWTNSAEIEGSDDDNNPGTPPEDDIDSEEDDDPTNDPGGTPDGNSDDEIDGDGTGDPEDDVADTDEDDQDPDKIEVFDLALKKRIEDRGPYFPGEIAEFVITVFNQGNVAATNIVISDTLKSGYAFPAPLNVLPLWAPELGNPSVVQHTILGILAPGDSINIVLNLEVAVDVFAGLEQWVNHAFIESAEDTEGNVRDDDADSTPGSNRPDELAVQPDTPDDNNILGGGPSVGEDEDDHDPELIIVVGALGDRVWKDLDGDGIQDPNEPGIEGVPVTLYRCDADTIVQQMVTDSDGEYFFENLIPGDYYVQFDITGLPVGCDFTFPNQGADDALDSDVDLTGTTPCTTIDGGERDSTWDAGLLILASLGDQVWHDLDGDGVQDPGEPGIADVEVNLYDGDMNFVGTTTTNPDGQYLFDLLYPGDYYVEFITPDGFELTFPNQGANDNLDSDVDGSQGPGTTAITNLTPGENDLSWDAGYYICSPVGDLVWYDTNENDIQDPAENGINGLRVNLWKFHFGEWIIWDFQYTGHKPGTPSDDGYFKFCAPPGIYYFEFELPPYGLVPAQAFAGGDPTKDSDVNNANGPQTTSSFTVLSATMWCDFDAGYYPMASVGDQVWRDDNGNGLQDLNEGPVQGVRVEAFDQNNDLIGTTYTDEDGEYMVDYLQKEGYYLRFSPGGSFGFTIPNVGDDTMDSDVNHANGPNTTGFYMMSPGVHIPNIDAGIVFGVVPIQLLDFTGQYKADYNYLEWTTETELNSDYFELERRFEKEKSFREIAKVAAAGVSQSRLGYNFGDYDIPSEGIYYYRLKQYDRDGKFEYSNVIGIEVNRPTTNSIALYPNPSTGITSLDINVSKEDNVNVSIYDVHGKLIKANLISEELSAGAHQKVLDLTDMPAGVYTISVKIGNTLTNKKLIRLKN